MVDERSIASKYVGPHIMIFSIVYHVGEHGENGFREERSATERSSFQESKKHKHRLYDHHEIATYQDRLGMNVGYDRNQKSSTMVHLRVAYVSK